MTRLHHSATELADAVIAAVGRDIVLGLPIGIGKATHVADALFERAAANPELSLTIFTGLTLEKPAAKTDLERRFLEPLTERLYADWPVPAYARAVREQSLPANIQVREFYLRPGAYLGNAVVQQNYTSINYSHVVGELLKLGVNVVAQLVASRPESPNRYSLSSNPEIALDLLPRFGELRQRGKRVALIAEVNSYLPYMLGDADLPEDKFDFVLDSPETDFPLFGLPNRPVMPADYATAMHVASLVRDGGTLQVGIGSLSDAVAHCLKLRHTAPGVFQDVLRRLPGGSASRRRQELPVECTPFETGLFASTELMSDALFSLFEADIVRRPADESDPSVIHAGFYIGSNRLYDGLHSLSEDERASINMTRISSVNTLFGDESRKRRQRRKGSFVNETMMVTLLGAAVSDALDNGQVVSGVGGQFDFVSMAHALEDGQSVLMVRASRLNKGRLQSNIRWSYAHATVPRHHRDVYVSEYGIAATRGKTDRQVIDAMIGIADSSFQSELCNQAIAAGKLEASYSPDDEIRGNTLQAVRDVFARKDIQPHFPLYPLGTEFTEAEQELVAALTWLGAVSARPWKNAGILAKAVLGGGSSNNKAALRRMNLQDPKGLKQRLTKRLLSYALEQAKL